LLPWLLGLLLRLTGLLPPQLRALRWRLLRLSPLLRLRLRPLLRLLPGVRRRQLSRRLRGRILVVVIHQALGLGLEDAQRPARAAGHLRQLLAPEEEEHHEDDDDQLWPAQPGEPGYCEIHVASSSS
jgi:hypothetical protein